MVIEKGHIIKLAYTAGLSHVNYPDGSIVFACNDKVLLQFAKQVLKEFAEIDDDSDGR